MVEEGFIETEDLTERYHDDSTVNSSYSNSFSFHFGQICDPLYYD